MGIQYSKEVLNCTEPDEPSNPAMKSSKAPGIDSLQLELLRADIYTLASMLTDLFQKIWEDTIPKDWSKGIIVKLSKKGDLSSCNNRWGITLLAIPSKVFCRILLKRVDRAIDHKLREEQAGFQRGRGCIDQIFTLCNMHPCLEWNKPLYINIIDFKKAFNSVCPPWELMEDTKSLWNTTQDHATSEVLWTL